MGAHLVENGVEFRVWAPRCRTVDVTITAGPGASLRVPLRREGASFEGVVGEAKSDSEYFYLLDGERERPDPRSRRQRGGVHGPSAVVDPRAFPWTDSAWRGIALGDYIIYKLHVGTFSPTSDYAGVTARLPYLRDLGVTAVELMPVSSFPGSRNWGYDGVHHFAPQESYGGPEAMRALVDAAHNAGIAVIMDVVYNHLGPEGNYLSEYGPYFTDNYKTPWGSALNFDGPDSDEVRDFVIENALLWLREYHVDALRLDAVHAIHDEGAVHILEELADRFREEAERLGRKAYLIAESDLNDPRLLRPSNIGGYGLDAQWHDEFHHALQAIVAGSTGGYFADYGRVADMAKALRDGFVVDGRYSTFRRRRFGRSSADRPGHQFVVFTQNHDQIANAAGGRRSAARLTRAEDALCAALLCFAPGLPLLFMGQEYGERAPFHYFISHADKELCRLVTEGRRKEHEAHGDPMDFYPPDDPATFEACRLRWESLQEREHAEMLLLYKDLIALRKRHAALHNGRKDLLQAWSDEDARWLIVRRADPAGASLVVAINLSARPAEIERPPEAAFRWRLLLCTRSSRYGLACGTSVPDCLPPSASLLLPPQSAVLWEEEGG